jgi:hypothetical protein
MVPLTPVAYMEGEMYRTNEVLVLLGDNWFCERSSYQAYQIVERRMDCEWKDGWNVCLRLFRCRYRERNGEREKSVGSF